MSKKWPLRFMMLASHVAGWSKDPSTSVGAVIVDRRRVVVGMGYNGFPRGVDDSEERYADRPTKYGMVVHAEINAILEAGHRARGGTLYVWTSRDAVPLCNECAKVIIQAGIVKVVEGLPAKSNTHAMTMLYEAGVEVVFIDRSEITGE